MAEFDDDEQEEVLVVAAAPGAEVVAGPEQQQQQQHQHQHQERAELRVSTHVRFRNAVQLDDAVMMAASAAAVVAASAAAIQERRASMLAAIQAHQDALVRAAAESEEEAAAAAAVAVAVPAVARRNDEERVADALPRPPPVVGAEVDGAAAAAAAAAAETTTNNGPAGVVVQVQGFRGAVTFLLQVANDVNDDHEGRPIIHHTLIIHRAARENNRQDHLFFHRFVELLLGQPQQQRGSSSGGVLRDIGLLVDWTGLPDEDMERLFRDVLPNHRALRGIHVSISDLPSRYFRMLTESVVPDAAAATATRASLLNLEITGDVADPSTATQVVQAIADMLDRNAAIGCLSVDSDLEADQCQLICQALRRNTNVYELDLSNVNEVLVDTLNGVVAFSSSLQRLCVAATFAEDAVSSLARQLRTNGTLLDLELDHYPVNDVRRTLGAVLLELVKTYNYTLRTVDAGDDEMRARLEPYLNRNDRIRRALDKLRNPNPDQRLVAPTKALMAHFLFRASDLPTALFRVMKHWYVHEVTARLSRSSRRERGRRQQPVLGTIGLAVTATR